MIAMRAKAACMLSTAILLCIAGPVGAQAYPETVFQEPLTISDQGSFFAGGTELLNEDGRSALLGQLYVRFQKPLEPRRLPLIMWHGAAQTGKTWESTPDGREGYDTIWLRRGYSVYVVDEPFIGRGSKPTVSTVAGPGFYDHQQFESFRWGQWGEADAPTPVPGGQAPTDEASLAQFRMQAASHLFPMQGPRPGSPDGISFELLPYPEAPDAAAALLEEVGPSILVTHSHGGFLGWTAALRSDDIRGIVTYEPVRFIFPKGEAPEQAGFAVPEDKVGPIMEIPLEEFEKFTKFPIQIVFGDNLGGPESSWNTAMNLAYAFEAVVERHGGDVEVLHLPDAGLTGNTHFPFADLNNIAVADLMEDWLSRKGLD